MALFGESSIILLINGIVRSIKGIIQLINHEFINESIVNGSWLMVGARPGPGTAAPPPISIPYHSLPPPFTVRGSHGRDAVGDLAAPEYPRR